MQIRRTAAALTVTAALSLSGVALAVPAQAQPVQTGLVNVVIGDVTVQLPIAIAANVCDVNVNVLAVQLREGPTTCEADADSEA